MTEDIEFDEGPERHEPFSDYEPKQLTAEELKLVGVTLLGPQDQFFYLKCDVCGWPWGIFGAVVGERPKGRYWICPNNQREGALSRLTKA